MAKWVLKSGQPVRVLDDKAKELVAKGAATYLSKNEARRLMAKNVTSTGATK